MAAVVVPVSGDLLPDDERADGVLGPPDQRAARGARVLVGPRRLALEVEDLGVSGEGRLNQRSR
jgi:hypothetical protein